MYGGSVPSAMTAPDFVGESRFDFELAVVVAVVRAPRRGDGVRHPLVRGEAGVSISFQSSSTKISGVIPNAAAILR